MQIQPILGYFWAIFGLYQPPAPPPFGSRPPPLFFTYPGSAPTKALNSVIVKRFSKVEHEWGRNLK